MENIIENQEVYYEFPAEQKEKPLLDSIENIIALANKHKFKEIFFKNAKPYLEVVALVLDITEVQAALLSLILEYSDDQPVSIGTIAKFMKCRKIQILKYMDDFEALENKNLIRAKRESYQSQTQFSPGYFVPPDAIKALRTGRREKNKTNSNLEPEAFFDIARGLFAAFRDKNINKYYMFNELVNLFTSNFQSAFVKNIRAFELSKKNSMLLLAFCCTWLSKDTEYISLSSLSHIFGFAEISQIERYFKTGEHYLVKENFITPGNDDGIADAETWTITQKTKETFLSDIQIKKKKQQNNENNIKAIDILEKQMFYSLKLNARVNELIKILTEDNFCLVKQRLTDNKMSTAFLILFQGCPGTGKTETAYQIARLTGRDICPVDISETKSQWFGESEKRIKAVFDRYKSMIKRCTLTPILLFNEADAVLGKRQELGETRRGPAQTENAIQNIILQEMENLHDGILIATTNMAVNLDKAFERRFLYKVEFEKPDRVARAGIWQSRLPELIPNDAQVLSARYEFSGGQIDNITRKQTINTVFNGNSLTLDEIIALCEDELLDKAIKQIGFCVN